MWMILSLLKNRFSWLILFLFSFSLPFSAFSEEKNQTGVLIIADFEIWPNNLGGQMWVKGGGEPDWDQPVHSWIYGPDTPKFDSRYVHTGKYSFRLVNATNPRKLPWAAFSIDLGPATDITVEPKKIASCHASDFSTLSFWVRGVKGGEKFEVSLRDASQREVMLLPLPDGAPKEWKEVRIPLSPLANEVNLSKLDVLNIHFGDSVGNPKNTVLYIDDVAFIGKQNRPQKTLLPKQVQRRGFWVADFEKELSLVGGEVVPYGGAKGNFNDRTQIHSALYDPKIKDYSIKNIFRGQGSYRLVNEMPLPSKELWASLAINLGPVDQASNKGVDLSTYRYLLFWAKGEHGGERIKVLFRDGNAPGYIPQVMYDPSPQILTTDWQKIVVPLSKIAYNVDLTNVVQIGIEFGSWLGNLKGDTLYVDDFVFSNLLTEP